MADILELTTQIVTAHVANNPIEAGRLPELIRSIYSALRNAGLPAEEPKTREPAVPIRKSVFDDHLICLQCGGSFKVLKRHLQTDHNLTIDQYRERFSLARDYPVIAPDYAKMRSKIAQTIGLGRKGGRARKAGRKRS